MICRRNSRKEVDQLIAKVSNQFGLDTEQTPQAKTGVVRARSRQALEMFTSSITATKPTTVPSTSRLLCRPRVKLHALEVDFKCPPWGVAYQHGASRSYYGHHSATLQ